MNKRNNNLKALTNIIFSSLLLLLVFGISACDRPVVGKEAPDTDEHDGHGHGKTSVRPKTDSRCTPGVDCDAQEEEHGAHRGESHEGHGHEEESDLDKTVEELFAASCEHGMKTHACDECRYEVGVVKVPQGLIEQGLIKIQKVTKRDFDSEITLTGEIRFDDRKVATLTPRVSGIVSRVFVDMGEALKPGQTLVELESVELAEVQSAYLETLANKHLARKAFERQQSLREQNITSEREFLEAERDFESADIQASSARQKLLRLGMSDSSVERLVRHGQSGATGKINITAPFQGNVLGLHASIGERIEPGRAMLQVGDTRSLWVWVDLYEAQLANVKRAMNGEGLPISLTVPAYGDETFSGRMDFVGQVMDEQTRTVKARVNIENPDGKLKPGMFARVRLGLDPTNGAAAAPVASVLSDEDRDFVFVHVKDDYFVRRSVTKGRALNGYLELLAGVEPGQIVAVAGAFLLKSDVLRSKMGEGCAH